MSENQLREAYNLMKQGDKRGAARLVQDVLREDRSNFQAWWLFSHILEDEEKIVKSLEKVLTLNPQHLGARKRLAQMRPEYAHLAPNPAEVPSLNKGKAGMASSSQKKTNKTSLLVGFVIFALSCLATMSFPFISNMLDANALANVEGPAPEDVAIRQITAALSGDYETMRQYTCDSLEDEWEAIMDDLNDDFSGSGFSIKDVDFDLSGLVFEEIETNGRQKILALSGEMALSFQGQHVSVDMEELTGFELHMVMVVNDNHWVVCST